MQICISCGFTVVIDVNSMVNRAKATSISWLTGCQPSLDLGGARQGLRVVDPLQWCRLVLVCQYQEDPLDGDFGKGQCQ